MSNCEHGYVVRSAKGANRYLCKECDERFIRHPDIIRRYEEGVVMIAQVLKINEDCARSAASFWEPETLQENSRVLIEQLLPRKNPRPKLITRKVG